MRVVEADPAIVHDGSPHEPCWGLHLRWHWRVGGWGHWPTRRRRLVLRTIPHTRVNGLGQVVDDSEHRRVPITLYWTTRLGPLHVFWMRRLPATGFGPEPPRQGDRRPAPHGRFQDGEPITCMSKDCLCQVLAPPMYPGVPTEKAHGRPPLGPPPERVNPVPRLPHRDPPED